MGAFFCAGHEHHDSEERPSQRFFPGRLTSISLWFLAVERRLAALLPSLPGRIVCLRPAMRMSLDDLVLSLQRAVDRLVRRLRRGTAPVPTHRRLLIVQIDGLSRVVLEQGLASGRMPFLKRLLRRHGYHLEPMTAGLPTSTPAFQMAAM
jgi:hypothetical protein